jgi:hypothetical protein
MMMNSPASANPDSTLATAVTYWDECWTHEKKRERWLMMCFSLKLPVLISQHISH